MVEYGPIASIACGTICVAIDWEKQPPHSDPLLIFQLPLADGILALLVLENRLVVEIFDTGEGKEVITDQWITPELVRPSGSATIVTLQWIDGIINCFRLNSKDVPRHSQAQDFILDSTETGAEENIDFSVQYQKFDLNMITKPQSITLRQLIQTVLRLEASLERMRSNTPEGIFDIAVYLRTLLCGQAKNGGRLLFRCAEEFSNVPICYTISGLDDRAEPPSFMDGNATCLFCDVAGKPSKQTPCETDLAKWLEQTALITFHQEKIPHWKLIYEVAGKFGAHADCDAMFLHSFMSPNDVVIDLGILVPQFRAYGEVALEASKRVIIQAQS